MKNIIIGIVIGVLVCGFSYQVYVNWQLERAFKTDHETLNTDHLTLVEVVNFINKSIETNQKK